jgi:hypothetical protein
MTKRALLFAAKFVILTMPLTWMWMEWGRGAYGRFFTYAVGPLYDLFDLGLHAGGARERYITYIPFFALMFITPRISLTRRLVGTAAGFLSIFTFHVVFSLWVQIAYPPGAPGTSGGFAIYLPAILLSDSLPLVLWAVLCQDYVREVASEALGRLGLTGARVRDPAPTTETITEADAAGPNGGA